MDAARYVLVHQMGRVGSTSLWRALQSHPRLDPERVGSTHRISDEAYAWRRWTLDRAGLTPGPETEWTRRARAWVGHAARDPSTRLDVCCPVRDPVARNLSMYFFERTRGDSARDAALRSHGPAEALDHFYRTFDHAAPLRWFDREVRGPLGIDVFEHDFLADRGHAIITRGNVRLLIFHAHTPDREKARTVSDFLGIEPFDILRLNRVGESASLAEPQRDADLYRRAREQHALDPGYVDALYRSRLARHFFGPDLLASWREEWTRGSAASNPGSGATHAA